MVSRELHEEEISRGALAFPVAKDAVVVTASEKNPFLPALRRQGLTQEALINVWVTEKIKTWGELLGLARQEPIHLYTRSDACGAGETWAAFLGARQEDLKGTGVYGDPGVAEAVKRDNLSLGYNNLNFAFDPKSLRPIKGLVVLPLDLNHNGKVDPEEDFVSDRSQITQAIREEKYPSPPSRNLYLVTKGEPSAPLLIAFLRYVLGDGQKLVEETGYIQVSAKALEEAHRRLLRK